MKHLPFFAVCLALAGCGSSDDTAPVDAGQALGDGNQDGEPSDGTFAGDGDGGSVSGDGESEDGSDGDGASQDGLAGDGSDGDVGGDGEDEPGVFALPPPNAGLDYQLGGAYAPPEGVEIVSRDRTAEPAEGLYNLCYVNGYQVQPGEESDWEEDLILRDSSGNPVIDPDWDELMLDVGSDDKRARIAEVVGGWIDGCASAGYDAVEIDNLDTYSRSDGLLSEDDAVAFMKLLVTRAHAAGMAIAQKNSAELLARRSEMGTDLAVVEECSRYDECSDFVEAYGDAVLMIEYRQNDFSKGCSEYGASHSIVLRDLNLVPEGRGAYVFEGC